MDNLVNKLNAVEKSDRLDALREIASELKSGKREAPQIGKDVNNHIHTTYSFSPYSPTKALYMAYMAGLETCGIMDHDSISGAEEFIEAGKIMGMATTIGCEMRVSLEGSPFADKRINNPDQLGNLYITVHGIPHSQIEKVKEYLAPINKARGERNRKMVSNINQLLRFTELKLDYDKDVLPLSNAHLGGGVTERHVLFALATALVTRLGKGRTLVNFLDGSLNIEAPSKIKKLLSDETNPHYEYDLLGLLKAEMVGKIYEKANGDECLPLATAIEFAKSIGAISCAPYLGDVGDSVTGDKKTQPFEDGFLDELFDYYAQQGFAGCAYMPSRNTMQQLIRVQELCKKHNLIQISGEDINQPRQPFICEAARDSQFDCLYDTTWALIGHELFASQDLENAIVSQSALEKYPNLDERIAAYKQIGLDYYKN